MKSQIAGSDERHFMAAWNFDKHGHLKEGVSSFIIGTADEV